MLRGAKIAAEWIAAPSADDIRARDNDRLVEVLLQPVELDETDRQLAARLLEKRSAEDLAAALVRMHRAKLPPPEDLLSGAAPQRRERGSGPEEPRPGFEDSAWFRLSVGRRRSEEHTSALQSLMRISYAVFCFKKNTQTY